MDFANIKEALDLTLFWEYRRTFFAGLAFNFYVFFLAAVLAICLGFLACMLRLSRHGVLRAVGTVHAELFRNGPEYVLLVWVHFVLPLILTAIFIFKINFAPFLSAVLALGLSYSGYFTETFRAGILAIPKGHIDAGRALGMSRLLILRRIILPQAVRQMLPEGMNQLISLFKATTLVSLIAVPDLLYQVEIVTAQEMRPLPLFSGAAITYFSLIFAMSSLVRMITDRWRTKGWA
jgi:His/Glu/Gln/Arg/opine family amino acid ABC transporter permease subunit